MKRNNGKYNLVGLASKRHSTRNMDCGFFPPSIQWHKINKIKLKTVTEGRYILEGAWRLSPFNCSKKQTHTHIDREIECILYLVIRHWTKKRNGNIRKKQKKWWRWKNKNPREKRKKLSLYREKEIHLLFLNIK